MLSDEFSRHDQRAAGGCSELGRRSVYGGCGHVVQSRGEGGAKREMPMNGNQFWSVIATVRFGPVRASVGLDGACGDVSPEEIEEKALRGRCEQDEARRSANRRPPRMGGRSGGSFRLQLYQRDEAGMEGEF